MLVVRGENVYPSAIEDALRAVPGFGGEFRIIVSRRETMDELLVRAEYTAEYEPGDRRDALRAAMRERLRARIGIHPVVDLVPQGTLPRSEFKARRVVDDRDLYREALSDERLSDAVRPGTRDRRFTSPPSRVHSGRDPRPVDRAPGETLAEERP
jgi:acyl-CoA synthetase (AMP-forming)/AMP-acid ligase II